jgi:hypothetical protein
MLGPRHGGNEVWSENAQGNSMSIKREDAECMAELQAAELLPVGATAITGTATSPPKPRNSAVSLGH